VEETAFGRLIKKQEEYMRKGSLLAGLVFVAFSGLAQAESMTDTVAPVEEMAMGEKGNAAAGDAGAPVMEVVNVGNKICPVLGNPVPAENAPTVEYKGKVYNLCCAMCKETFLKDPEAYVKKVEAALAAAGQ